jgi:AcrR family transcriptional regulator
MAALVNLRPKQKQQTYGRLFAVARAQFEDHGYAGADIRSIASQAATSIGSLYRFWPEGKRGLWRDVMGDEGAKVLFGEKA